MKEFSPLRLLLVLVWTLAAAAATADEDPLAQHPYLTQTLRKAIKPFLIPDAHPLKPALDAIFRTRRATLNTTTLTQAGFKILFRKQRSFIIVASHPKLPGHLVKLYLDTENRLKQGTPGWVWLARRCKAARQVRAAIKAEGATHFQVPRKWLYALPPEPSPPPIAGVQRQPIILLVEDMRLLSSSQNLKAWKTRITPQHLDELYRIIRRAGGSSYRPDNIWLSKNGKFSFIDTEYPSSKPNFKELPRYLSSPMRRYWSGLVNE